MSDPTEGSRSGRADARPRADGPPVRFHHFELHEANASLMRDGKAVALAPTPFAVLCALVRQPGVLLTKQALLDQVWGHQFVSESVLKTVISELRTVLEDDARQPRFIETVSRRGYRFIAPTVEAAAPRREATSGGTGPSASPAFIGRQPALARLRSAWDRACAGKRTVAWVTGEPGIGKTTLIEHFVAGLGDITCIRGQCVEQYSGGESFLPVLEALAELCRRDTAAAPLLRAVAPSWLLQLPWLSTPEERDALRRELAGTTPDRRLREMGELLDRYTERQPLLLVTEDLHWSDAATIQLIDYLARRRGSARLMWLASFRLAEVVALDHPLNRLRRELRLHGLCDEIVLDLFSEQEVAEYVAQPALPVAKNEGFVRALHARTDGLPLFVASAMSEIAARDAEGGGSDAAEHVASMPVPESLAALIDHYVAKLGDERRMLLAAAAVCGVEFRVGTVAEVLKRDPAWASQICAELERERVWLAASRAHDKLGAPDLPEAHAFRHALFRQVLYERTPPATLAQLHGQVGAALKRERARGVTVAPAELAIHFERAHEPIEALRYYAEGAETALANFDAGECLRIADRALQLLERPPNRRQHVAAEFGLQTLRGLAATRVLGVGNEARDAFQRAYALLDEVPEHPMRGRLLQGFGFMLSLRAEYADALAVADRALAVGSITSDPVLSSAAFMLHGQVDQLQGRSRGARQWLERSLALAERLDVAPGEYLVDPQVAVLSSLAITLVHLGQIEQARACVERATVRGRERGWPMAQLTALWRAALLEVRVGNAKRVASLVDAMEALMDEFALGHGRTACRWFRGWVDARMGQPREGHRQIREAYEENIQLGMLAGSSEILGYAAEALSLAGDWDAARQELQEALRVADLHAERVYLPQLYLLEGTIARALGDPAAAGASLRHALEEARAQEAPWLELLALTALCEHGDGTAKDKGALAALVKQLPEARGTEALAKAQSLLGTKRA
jgi:DNA-binding winged helix-turn-helix (wHTH) protein/tetratricopeptide (TPR) repeat protein